MKIALVSRHTPFESGAAERFAEELAERLRQLGHAVEPILLPLQPTPQQRLVAELFCFDTGEPDSIVIAENAEHANDWDDTIGRILDKDASANLFRYAPITDAESMALADSVSAILAELGSNTLDDLAETMGRLIAELGRSRSNG